MADKLTLDVGLAVDLKAGFARNGWTEAQIKRLSQGTFLKEVLDALEGRSEIKPCSGSLVDLDADPHVPDGWEVRDEDQLPNRARGTIDLATAKFCLYLAKAQKKGVIGGEALRADLADEPVLGVNALDFYLKNPHLIPADWKGKRVCFWGTIYRDGGGSLCVRYLFWHGGRWHWDYYWLDGGWDSDDPAVLASS